MAAMDFIDRAREELEAQLLDLETVLKMASEAVGENDEPSWLFVLHKRYSAISDSAEAYMMAVHEHARPVLNDLSKLTRS